MNVQGFYDGVRIELPQTGIYYLSNPSLDNYPFGAVYYGVSGTQRSEQPSTSFPLGYRMDLLNDIQPPRICGRCMTGPNCNTAIIHTCACNPCENFDDVCTDGANPRRARFCESIVDTTGNPFTLMFMQNRPDNTEKRELVRMVYISLTNNVNEESSQIILPYQFLHYGSKCHTVCRCSDPGWKC